MKKWVRRKEGRTEWHWCNNCPYYPENGEKVQVTNEEPQEGAFCHVCTKLEHEGKCGDEGRIYIRRIRPKYM